MSENLRVESTLSDLFKSGLYSSPSLTVISITCKLIPDMMSEISDRQLERVVALIDMDCFYVQVEQRECPETWGTPCAVVQYNEYKGGGIIAVNYEARGFGVTRNGMRGEDAKSLCPDLRLFRVPESRGKADLSRYRSASAEVFNVMCGFSDLIVVERASVDEAYLDLTQLVKQVYPNVPEFAEVSETFVEGIVAAEESPGDGNKPGQETLMKRFMELPAFARKTDEEDEEQSVSNLNDINLLIGAKIINEIRSEVFNRTKLRCSAGLSHNKILAKLACGLHKPNAQTLLPKRGVHQLFSKTPISKVRNLGGKFGSEIKAKLNVETMGQLSSCSLEELIKLFGNKSANYLMDLSHGIDDEVVVSRQISKSLGCAKNFPGKSALTSTETARQWVSKLCQELEERLIIDKKDNNRVSCQFTVGIRLAKKDPMTRSLPLYEYNATKIEEDIMRHVVSKLLLDPNGTQIEAITMLSISASKFVESDLHHKCALSRTNKLQTYFNAIEKPVGLPSNAEAVEMVTSTCTSLTEPNIAIVEEAVTPVRVDSSETTAATTSASNLIVDLAEADCYQLPNIPVKRGFFYRKSLELASKRMAGDRGKH